MNEHVKKHSKSQVLAFSRENAKTWDLEGFLHALLFPIIKMV